jgi:hypothetical protein
MALLQGREVAKLTACRDGSIFGRHSLANESIGEQLQVCSHFIF